MDAKQHYNGDKRNSLTEMEGLTRKSVNWARRKHAATDDLQAVGDAGTPPLVAPHESIACSRAFHRTTSITSTTGGISKPGSMYGVRYGRMGSGTSHNGSTAFGAGGGGSMAGEAADGGSGGGAPGQSERSRSLPARAAASRATSVGPLTVNVGGSFALSSSASPNRPATSDMYGGGASPPPSTPSSPSKVGLSARQRAMIDASHVGTFRFARIRQPPPGSGGGGSAAANGTTCDGDDRSMSPSPAAPAPAANGLRTGANVMVAVSGFQSPLAPYRRTAPPLPAANYGPSGASPAPPMLGPQASNAAFASALLHELNAPLIDHNGGGGGGGGGTASGADASAAACRDGGGAAVEMMERSAASVGGIGVGGIGSAATMRTEVLASFVRPGRGVVLQPGLQQLQPTSEPDVSDAAEALLLGSSAPLGPSPKGGGGPHMGGGGGGPLGDPAFDPAAASSALIDAELAPLLREVAEINVKPEVRAALGSLDDRAIKQLFAATSRRVEHLPCTPVSLSSGAGLLMPLPGPKGVPGFRVNHKGQVHPTAIIKAGRFFRDAQAAAAGGKSAEAALLQSLLDEDPDSISPKTRALLVAHGPAATLELVEAEEREAAAAAAAAAPPSTSMYGTCVGGGGGGSPWRVSSPRVSLSPRRRSTAGGGDHHYYHGRAVGGCGGGGGGASRPCSPPYSHLVGPHGGASAHAGHPAAPSPQHGHALKSQATTHNARQHHAEHVKETVAAPANTHGVSGGGGGGGGGGGAAGGVPWPDPRFASHTGSQGSVGGGGGDGQHSTPQHSSSSPQPPTTTTTADGDVPQGARLVYDSGGGGSGRQSPRAADLRVRIGALADSGSGAAGASSPDSCGAFAGGAGVAAAAAAVSTRSGGGSGTDRSEDPLEDRRRRLGRMMAELDAEQVTSAAAAALPASALNVKRGA
ncbi:hypothetical protein Agub_g2935 [Astrephomene gubernaculifera]|uniref:Uncharacterized protein n=1 Tax=Astrephomene gubernaculifera TaxID=47775 RepID=A0AAD3HIN9_9CHLO|nr:hypothetical protein Agub_g2935 [Astrephomene gubernaculifera]